MIKSNEYNDISETIFPPVFGRRLQAQVVKRGDRVLMEVEITGTPEPTVTWYKDDVLIKEQPPALRIRQEGNCYILQIDKGKYLVIILKLLLATFILSNIIRIIYIFS